MASEIILVTGGARSGKSVFAERWLASCPGRKAYVATAQALDREMEERIVRHRRRRPASWLTYEVPYDLSTAMVDILHNSDAVLIDCLTLYFSNFLLQNSKMDFDLLLKKALAELEAILQRIQAAPDKRVVFVTNELGSGIVPMGQLARNYRDLMGLINQRTASTAAQVFFAVSGIVTEIKSRQIILPDVGDR